VKLLAFITDWAASLPEDRLLAAFKDYLSLNQTPIPPGDDNRLRMLLRVCKGFRTFADVVTKTGVLFGPDDTYAFDPKAVDKVLVKGDRNGYSVLADLQNELTGCEWTAEAIEALLKAYCEKHNLGMGKVAQPIRVAVTGTTISPAIYDTLVILGKDKTLARIARCLEKR